MVPEHGDPAEIAAVRDSVRLAFVTALQHLPAEAAGGADPVRGAQAARRRGRRRVLDSTVASVNSALQRARTTLAGLPEHQRPGEVEPENAELLAKYVDAFQRYDVQALIGLLREDALQTMPPFEMWIQGASAITAWMVEPGPSACAGSILVPVRANGVRAWAQYKPDPEHGGFAPWALLVHEVERRQDQPDDVLPRHRAAVPAVRAAGQALRRSLTRRGLRGPLPG